MVIFCRICLFALIGLNAKAEVYDKAKLDDVDRQIRISNKFLESEIEGLDATCKSDQERCDGNNCPPISSCERVTSLRIQRKQCDGIMSFLKRHCDDILPSLDLGGGKARTTDATTYGLAKDNAAPHIQELDRVSSGAPYFKSLTVKGRFCKSEMGWLAELEENLILNYKAKKYLFTDDKCTGAAVTELYILQDIGEPMKPVVDRLKKDLPKYLNWFTKKSQTQLKVGLGTFTGKSTDGYPKMNVFANVLGLTSDFTELVSAYNSLELVDRSTATNSTLYEAVNKSVQSDSGVGWAPTVSGAADKALHRYVLLMSDRDPLVAQNDQLVAALKTLNFHLITITPNFAAGGHHQFTWPTDMGTLQVAHLSTLVMTERSCYDGKISSLSGKDLVAMADSLGLPGVACTNNIVCDAVTTIGLCNWDDSTVCVCAEGYKMGANNKCGLDCSSCNTGLGYEDNQCTIGDGGELTCTCSDDYTNLDAATCTLDCSKCTGDGYENKGCSKVEGGQLICRCSEGYTETAPGICTKGNKCSVLCRKDKGYLGTCRTEDKVEKCNCSDGFVNTELDECTERNTSCDPNLCPQSTTGYTGVCKQIDANAYSCVCNDNYENKADDNTTCVALDCSSCDASVDGYEGNCKKPGGTLTCDCSNGYTNSEKDALKCVDACMGQCAGEGESGCTTSGTSASCACQSGYTLTSALVCTKGDPCDNITCREGLGYTGQCENRAGIGTCTCTGEYKNGDDPTTCSLNCGLCKDPNYSGDCSLSNNTLTCGCNKGFKNATPLTCVGLSLDSTQAPTSTAAPGLTSSVRPTSTVGGSVVLSASWVLILFCGMSVVFF